MIQHWAKEQGFVVISSRYRYHFGTTKVFYCILHDGQGTEFSCRARVPPPAVSGESGQVVVVDMKKEEGHAPYSGTSSMS
jgi:hypothetical protein